MTIFKRTAGIILSLIIAASVIAVPTAVSAKTKKISFMNMTVAVNSYKSATFKSNYANINIKYKTSNKKVAKVINEREYKSAYTYNYSTDTSSNYVTVKGLKKGTATITAYKADTDKKLGSFKVTVKNKKASIRSKYKTLTLKYNPCNKGVLKKSAVFTSLLVNNPQKGAVYTAKVKNTKVAKVRKGTKFKANSFVTINQSIESKSKGSTKVTVYEKLSGKKKTKVGTFTLKTVYADTAQLLKDFASNDGDGLYYEQFVHVGDTFNVVNDFKGYYLNKYIGDFSKASYSLAFSAINPKYMDVDEKGNVTVKAVPEKDGIVYGIKISIEFTDKSKFTIKNVRPDIVPDNVTKY
ncbi:MAG: hypothetical protein VZQ55_03250 [Ruminococcus sp.]|nr:hypothetical protein [Ruminococcus sp.]